MLTGEESWTDFAFGDGAPPPQDRGAAVRARGYAQHCRNTTALTLTARGLLSLGNAREETRHEGTVPDGVAAGHRVARATGRRRAERVSRGQAAGPGGARRRRAGGD